MKEQLLADIANGLAALGFDVRRGDGTDISIGAELLDAGWSTGEKHISYEAYVLADEATKTVLMHERTLERGRGFSFGLSFGSTAQRGKTLYRLIKQAQYGPEGKAFEYSFNLGAIPAAVADTAKSHGWRFRSVVRRRSAMYAG